MLGILLLATFIIPTVSYAQTNVQTSINQKDIVAQAKVQKIGWQQKYSDWYYYEADGKKKMVCF
ncbi:hypothetical protein [Bacillus paranthracis]